MSGQNSGKRWADLAPLPWAALEQDTGLVLKRELRLEILQRVPLWLGGGQVGGGGREEHDFLFQYFGSRSVCSRRCPAVTLQTQFNHLLLYKKESCRV